MPATEAQLSQLVQQLRRQGHLSEGTHGNIGTILNGPMRQARPGAYLAGDAGSQQLEGDTLNAADVSNLPPLSGDSDGPPPLDTSSGSDKELCDEDVEAIANWRSKKQRTVARSTLSAEVTAEAAEYVAEYVARSLAPPPLPPPAEPASDLSMMD